MEPRIASLCQKLERGVRCELERASVEALMEAVT
jgi:hypothetical protein